MARLKPGISYPFVLFSHSFSTSPHLLNGRPTFVPAKSPSAAHKSWNESPVKEAPTDTEVLNAPSRGTIDRYAGLGEEEFRLMPRTGPMSGRTVAVFRDRVGMGMARLNRILKANNVVNESKRYMERLPPHLVRNRKRAAAHRRRFAQGVARMAGIVLRMRRKSH
jgi:ribosomal protein S21